MPFGLQGKGFLAGIVFALFVLPFMLGLFGRR